VFVLGKHFMPVACLRAEYLSGALLGNALALIENMTLSWEGLPWTNTLAYHEHSTITDVKIFLLIGPGR